jgi:hypothetical protein
MIVERLEFGGDSFVVEQRIRKTRVERSPLGDDGSG